MPIPGSLQGGAGDGAPQIQQRRDREGSLCAEEASGPRGRRQEGERPPAGVGRVRTGGPFSAGHLGSPVNPGVWAHSGWCRRSLPRGLGGAGRPHCRADTALGAGRAPKSDRRGWTSAPTRQLSRVTLKSHFTTPDSVSSVGPMVLTARRPVVPGTGGSPQHRAGNRHRSLQTPSGPLLGPRSPLDRFTQVRPHPAREGSWHDPLHRGGN